ncbi:MAG TPA: TetR family transcriptional regulator [Galbitalea sp.]|jgi:AcrR family transcriptional regulator|nr:TetR family transcriptional regulator [Galbitalea sp.]
MSDMDVTAVKGSDEPDAAARHRDADGTRQRLLQAARQRFAMDGYAATTVRDIATDAGVNVALINRYFTSKEGLFEACLDRTVKELGDRDTDASTVDQIVTVMLEQMLDTPADGRPLQLLLLLRSTGEPEVDEIRRRTLRDFSERMATAAGWSPQDARTGDLVLRAQLVLATAFGILLLRASTALEPLRSATDTELRGPLGDAVTALLSARS